MKEKSTKNLYWVHEESRSLIEGRLCLPLSGQKSQYLATNQLKSSGIIWTFLHSSKRKHETKQLFKIWYI